MEEHNHATDDELLQAFRDGDVEAFAALYARHRTAVYSYIRLHAVGARADALFQATWTELIDRRTETLIDGEVAARLYRIAHRRVSEALAVEGASWDEVEQQEIAAAALRLQDITHRSRSRALRLRRTLGELPEPQRESFLLYEAGALRLPTVAAVADAEVETAVRRIHQAVRALRAGIDRAGTLLR